MLSTTAGRSLGCQSHGHSTKKKVAFPLKWNPLKNEIFVHSCNIVANHYSSEYLPCSKSPLQAEIFCSDHLKQGVEIFDDLP